MPIQQIIIVKLPSSEFEKIKLLEVKNKEGVSVSLCGLKTAEEDVETHLFNVNAETWPMIRTFIDGCLKE